MYFYSTSFLRIQSDAIPCSDVFNAFPHLEDKMHAMTNIDAQKKTYLMHLVKQRFQFMYGDAHSIAYLVDPRYLEDRMTRKLRNVIEDFIFAFPNPDGTTDQERREQPTWEYTSFRIDALKEREENIFRFKIIGETKPCFEWWKANDTDWSLSQDLAILVFLMAASAAASERNFSTFGFGHNKLRNRLGAEKVRKLVCMKTNSSQLEGPSSWCYDNSDIDDVKLVEVNEELMDDERYGRCVIYTNIYILVVYPVNVFSHRKVQSF